MKISKIEVQKKNKRRFNLYSDDTYQFSISEDTLVHFHIQKNQSWTEAELEDMQRYEIRMQCLSQAYRYLARRPHLRAELRTKLRQKEYDADSINFTIELLAQKKYLDDNDFIIRFIADQVQLKQSGPLKIRQKLLQKGADSGLTDLLLDKYYSKNKQIENARRAYEKRRKRSDTPDKQKLIRNLLQKGFTWEVVNQLQIKN